MKCHLEYLKTIFPFDFDFDNCIHEHVPAKATAYAFKSEFGCSGRPLATVHI